MRVLDWAVILSFCIALPGTAAQCEHSQWLTNGVTRLLDESHIVRFNSSAFNYLQIDNVHGVPYSIYLFDEASDCNARTNWTAQLNLFQFGFRSYTLAFPKIGYTLYARLRIDKANTSVNLTGIVDLPHECSKCERPFCACTTKGPVCYNGYTNPAGGCKDFNDSQIVDLSKHNLTSDRQWPVGDSPHGYLDLEKGEIAEMSLRSSDSQDLMVYVFASTPPLFSEDIGMKDKLIAKICNPSRKQLRTHFMFLPSNTSSRYTGAVHLMRTLQSMNYSTAGERNIVMSGGAVDFCAEMNFTFHSEIALLPSVTSSKDNFTNYTLSWVGDRGADSVNSTFPFPRAGRASTPPVFLEVTTLKVSATSLFGFPAALRVSFSPLLGNLSAGEVEDNWVITGQWPPRTKLYFLLSRKLGEVPMLNNPLVVNTPEIIIQPADLSNPRMQVRDSVNFVGCIGITPSYNYTCDVYNNPGETGIGKAPLIVLGACVGLGALIALSALYLYKKKKKLPEREPLLDNSSLYQNKSPEAVISPPVSRPSSARLTVHTVQ